MRECCTAEQGGKPRFNSRPLMRLLLLLLLHEVVMTTPQR
jgi:hypothetical protein